MSIEFNHEQLLLPHNFIAGKWVDAISGQRIDVENPASEQTIGTVPNCGQIETEQAIAAAEHGFRQWRALSSYQRAELLKNWQRQVIKHKQALARVICLEQGKPWHEALAEVQTTADYLEWYAEEACRLYGETLSAPSNDRRMMVTKQAVGVCAAITPWNFPASMIARKAGAALAAGCTVVIKPSELTPFSALALASLADQAGLPAGVINVITGHPTDIGAALTASDTVKVLSFTGSTEIGELLMRQCAPSVKKLALELGGNAPFIVFESADLDIAVAALMQVKFRNSGQTCVSANRVFLAEPIAEAFLTKLDTAVSELTLGTPADYSTGEYSEMSAAAYDIGPLIDAEALAKVSELVDAAQQQGAQLRHGGTQHCKGRFFPPTVLTHVAPDSDIMQREIFGPVAAISTFVTESQALAHANSTRHGLCAYFFSQDFNQVWRVSDQLEFGMVGVNSGSLSSIAAPFGGIKASGLGREGGKYGVDAFVELKYVNFANIY